MKHIFCYEPIDSSMNSDINRYKKLKKFDTSETIPEMKRTKPYSNERQQHPRRKSSSGKRKM